MFSLGFMVLTFMFLKISSQESSLKSNRTFLKKSKRLVTRWEFQVGPLSGIQTADQVILTRYILVRLAEIHNVKILFRNIDCARHTNARQTFHLNFSTRKTRADADIKNIYDIIEIVSKYPQEAMFNHYDHLSNGGEMKWYLDCDFYMPLYHAFKHTVGDKHESSIRIPTRVANEGKGYLEERMPVPNANPYDVCRVFTIAAFLGLGVLDNWFYGLLFCYLFDHIGEVSN